MLAEPNFTHHDHGGQIDWAGYFSARRRFMEQLAEEPEEEPASVTVRPFTIADTLSLPAKPRQVALWAQENGLDVRIGYHETYHRATVYAADSKERDKEGSPVRAAGTPKTPARQYVHWHVIAKHEVQGKRAFAFSGHWREGSFQEARTWDAIGTPVEIYFDYFKGAPAKDRPAAERQAFEERASSLDREYNDGQLMVRRENWLTSDTDFRAWLAELAELLHLNPIAVPKARAAKKQAPEPGDDMNLLNQGEWSA